MEKPKLSYWLVAGLGLIWSVMGCLNYIVQTNAETVARLPADYQALIASRPGWATAAFAIAVFGGAVGCILLLLRRRVAVNVLLLSLIATVVTMLHGVMAAGLSSQVLVGAGMSAVVSAVLWWTGRMAASRGWLR